MSVPLYVNFAEIVTYGSKEEGNLVMMRFLYKEPNLQVENTFNRPYPLVFPGPAVLMPRKTAKDFLKKFLGFMANQDEHTKEVK